MSIRVHEITKSWGSFTALKNISLNVHDHELLALLGPSGSGKTTLLRIIAGLESPDCGEVYLNDENATFSHVRNRRIGFVFQHYAIFRHMSVFDNVAFGLRVKPRRERPDKAEIRRRVDELLQLVHIEQFSNRKPAQLSGGQRQRVALARALAVQPRVLLLDEPFGALDAKVRCELRSWLRNLQRELGITTVMVTHDQDEAMEVADRVVVMNEGRIEQVGTPAELWEQPISPFVFDFLGDAQLFDGRVHAGKVELPGWRFASNGWREGEVVRVGVRSHDIRLSRSGNGPAKLCRMLPSGEYVRLEVQLPGRQQMTARIHRQDSTLVELHEGCAVEIIPSRMFVFSNGEPPAVMTKQPVVTAVTNP